MKKAAARGVGRRALQVPAKILAAEMAARAEVLTAALRNSIKVIREKAAKGRPQVSVIADDPAAIPNEFGTMDMTAQPFGRPALDSKKGEMLTEFGKALDDEVQKTVIRAERRAARAEG
jgi:HK97 gp10 family phage protein